MKKSQILMGAIVALILSVALHAGVSAQDACAPGYTMQKVWLHRLPGNEQYQWQCVWQATPNPYPDETSAQANGRILYNMVGDTYSAVTSWGLNKAAATGDLIYGAVRQAPQYQDCFFWNAQTNQFERFCGQ